MLQLGVKHTVHCQEQPCLIAELLNVRVVLTQVLTGGAGSCGKLNTSLAHHGGSGVHVLSVFVWRELRSIDVRSGCVLRVQIRWVSSPVWLHAGSRTATLCIFVYLG